MHVAIRYNQFMLDAPLQNWAEYEKRARPVDIAWNRGLSIDDKFSLYADMFRVVMNARGEEGDWERLETWRWQEKRARRAREVTAFQKLDQLRRERSTPHDSR
jgi:hypothetical protein